jgi:hypothetical protein
MESIWVNSDEYLGPYRDKLIELEKNITFDQHKIQEVIGFIDKGAMAFMMERTELIKFSKPIGGVARRCLMVDTTTLYTISMFISLQGILLLVFDNLFLRLT